MSVMERDMVVYGIKFAKNSNKLISLQVISNYIVHVYKKFHVFETEIQGDEYA